MTENNGRVRLKKIMSKRVWGYDAGEENDNDKNDDNDKNCYCQLFVKSSFVFKLSGLNGYLKSMINKLPKK